MCFHRSFLYLFLFKHKINLLHCNCNYLIEGCEFEPREWVWNLKKVSCVLITILFFRWRNYNANLCLIPQANYFYSIMLPPFTRYIWYKLTWTCMHFFFQFGVGAVCFVFDLWIVSTALLFLDVSGHNTCLASVPSNINPQINLLVKIISL